MEPIYMTLAERYELSCLLAAARRLEEAMTTDKPDVAALTDEQLYARCQNYLASGGLWNPESMEHDKVRDLIRDIRDHMHARASLPANVPADVAALIARLRVSADAADCAYLDSAQTPKLLREAAAAMQSQADDNSKLLARAGLAEAERDALRKELAYARAIVEREGNRNDRLNEVKEALKAAEARVQELEQMNAALQKSKWIIGETCAKAMNERDEYKRKWHECRRYLRAANKGAERLSKVCQLRAAQAVLQLMIDRDYDAAIAARKP